MTTGAAVRYRARIEEVRSGDDMVAMIDLGVDGLHKHTRIRLLGVDTPSAFRQGPDSDAGKIRDAVRDLVQSGECAVEVSGFAGKGGWLVTLYVQPKGSDAVVCVNDHLRGMGHIYAPRHGTEGWKQ